MADAYQLETTTDRYLLEDGTGVYLLEPIVIPDTATVTITLYAPTVLATALQNVTPGTASVTMTAYAPTVFASDPKDVTPGTATGTITLYAPTVFASDLKNVTPGTASVSLTASAPTVGASDHKTVTPGAATMTTATYLPTVTTTAHQFAFPLPASLVTTRYAPEVAAASDEVAVIIYGGDDARKPRRKSKTFRELFQEVEQTIHALVSPEPEQADAVELATPDAVWALDTKLEELLALAAASHDALQQVARLRRDADAIQHAWTAQREAEAEDEELLMWG